MKFFFAPWRLEFIISKKPDGCVFCNALSEKKDDHYHILKRGENCFAMLNKYPYTSGHVLIIPNRHTGDYSSLTKNELLEMATMTQGFTDILKKTFSPQGFNIGMNIGRFAGAGIEDHLHTHIVPRWSGDNNFMPVIAETKIHPMDLDRVFELIMQEIG